MAAHTVQFSNAFAALPSTAPANHPHLIDLATYTPPHANRQTNMKLPDAIVTMLHQISPTALGDFLDPNKASFRLIQTFKDKRETEKLVIAKNGDKVLVGVFTEHAEQGGCFEFDNLVHFTVAQDGSWDITYMSYRDYFRRNWAYVWAGQTVDLGFGFCNMKATPLSDPVDCWNLLPFQLADNIMTNCLWDAVRSDFTIV
ncbi:hypothetical protein HBH56_042650 [Parastagonospora nodorum]|uniref:Uncharacterized protein n=1 Tax=Phaeosphaeria nodorum (strain SN15 / ATCC MYA-4574 / FGSC 10173) TaxID=321614 RepID=A0A7U2EU78_PHANO|nr:hypothetical protein HBH56_042650 [Parastagonospora nodorum]QRC92912.1 hypothetical protein JI435_080400 [Parastagonospora nodorum SN15]KAH3932832.1 hypothetical protein HBH54_070400 [Parastagonospora nodorum]KAH4055663.1 hypothetical protein HBH49_062020 [Parastagonospora nodorum]KAH4102116.1 hypothetical protein HBH46_129170 [Parastagonospora nodorum]